MTILEQAQELYDEYLTICQLVNQNPREHAFESARDRARNDLKQFMFDHINYFLED